MQKSFSFDFKDKNHEAIIIAPDISTKPTFVLIHGATGSKELIHPYADALLEKGIATLAFDQSGTGKDAVNLKRSSLQARVEESKYAIENFAAKEPLIVRGSSMGGEIAIRMTEFFPVKSLILFCPAIYDEAAFGVTFGEGFSTIIAEPESWKKSAALDILEKFTGKLLIVIGEEDEVIPPGVIALLDAHSSSVSKKEIFRIPGCPHKYQKWLAEHSDVLEKVEQKVVEFSL